MGVGFARGFAREKERLAAFEAGTDVQGKVQAAAFGGEGFVGFDDAALLKQGLIGATAFRAAAEEDDARRILVEAGQRRDVFGSAVVQLGAQAQAGEQGFAQEAAAGHNG
ncbi:hypothetical protein HMPREF9120_02582 [Neisseria sp. oral taxon 020 str. F0370]|nr:hypothetical protein HMPREF9120_02582 [Neisseria sp. oral taxon 020 str. F0370]